MLDPAQLDVAGTGLLRREHPPIGSPELFVLNNPEKGYDTIAQRDGPASLTRFALGIEIECAVPVDVFPTHPRDCPVSQAESVKFPLP